MPFLRNNKVSGQEAGYSPIFVSVYSGMVRFGNRILKLRQTAALWLMAKNPKSRSDQKTYAQFVKLIPHLSDYSYGVVLRHLRLFALKKRRRSLASCYALVAEDPEALAELKGNLTHIGSHFFRGDVWPQFRDLCKTAFAGQDDLKVWCAGCSSGKEVYSVLMMLSELFPEAKIDLLATDYNQEMLRQCREGVYSLRTIDEIPVAYRHLLEKYIGRPQNIAEKTDFSHRFQFRICTSLRDCVETRYLNLLSDTYPSGFDLVLCRNVIKFFEVPVRHQVQRQLAASLNPGGLLFVSDELEKEGIPEPESLHLRQERGSCIYRKDS